MNEQFMAKSFNDIYPEISLHLLRPTPINGVGTIHNKNGEMLTELVNPTFQVNDITHCFATCRDLSLDYLKGELEFYLSGSPYLEDIAKYSKFWEKVSDDGRTINSNYGQLLLHKRNVNNYTQYEYAHSCLIRNKESKKAVMTIYDSDNARPSKDNPCTMHLQFLIRDDTLHLFVKMRSSDIWFGLPYDVPFFVFVQAQMYMDLLEVYPDLMLGKYVHNTGSLHLYHRNSAKLEAIIVEWFQDLDRDYTQKDLYNEIILKRLNTWKK